MYKFDHLFCLNRTSSLIVLKLVSPTICLFFEKMTRQYFVNLGGCSGLIYINKVFLRAEASYNPFLLIKQYVLVFIELVSAIQMENLNECKKLVQIKLCVALDPFVMRDNLHFYVHDDFPLVIRCCCGDLIISFCC